MPGAGAERDDDLARDRRSGRRPERSAGRLRDAHRERSAEHPSAERPDRRGGSRREEGARAPARSHEPESGGPAGGAGEHDSAAPGRVRTAREAAVRAAHHVRDLTGGEPEGVTSLERTGAGWRVDLEVVESRRIPDSTDILAVYRVEVDDEGELVSYRRAGRYYRGRAQEGEP